MKHITEETIKKIQEIINNESYFCNENFEEKVVNEMVNKELFGTTNDCDEYFKNW